MTMKMIDGGGNPQANREPVLLYRLPSCLPQTAQPSENIGTHLERIGPKSRKVAVKTLARKKQ